MLRLGASLERVPAEHKAEIGDWLVQRLRHAAARPGHPATADPWTLWALGRLGARVPLYGSAHGVVAGRARVAWLEVLLALDWKQVDGAAAAAANLARRSGDRARDLPPETGDRVISGCSLTLRRRPGSSACARSWRSTKPASAACSATRCHRG